MNNQIPVKLAATPLALRPKLLEMRSIAKVFAEDVVALSDMNLTVNVGDFISLLGPSGCGKSTALRLIADLIHPTTGRINWSETEHNHTISVVFQEPTLMPWATVGQNVWLPFRLASRSYRSCRDEILEALRLVSLENFEESYPRELSGGMKMRTSIARALITRPSIMLMDEPFAALDEINRFKLNHDLLQLKEKIGCTVIFVTHSVFESVFLSDRIVVMAAQPGRVHRELTIEEPYPRSDSFRTSAEYSAYCRTASEALQEAMGETN